ncbi:DUF4301 family protein [Aureitalea sp. L0-47]|uniref:DUF4301 family protein n=1 Tax=Aureitalea sp. L0-47 TaxID=2816962 RepID=UPI002238A4A3|nr:DUF4301 family protein [Aureitalea sp. L0-47]MCW5518407.1 DUF4301 family protein [Aureitalea sp. L0-47]
MLTEKDLQQLKDHGISLQTIYRQLETFSLGIPPADIVTAASVGNGIEVIPEDKHQKLIDLYEESRNTLDIVKFVPASGAATRMFQFLHNFLEEYDPATETLKEYLNRCPSSALEKFIKHSKEFAFINEVRKMIRKNYPEYKKNSKGQRMYWFVKMMLEPEGLNFSNMPKGLIPFHKYSKYYTTAFEEQLFEAAHYASVHDDAYLHFTFSEKHVPYFKQAFETIRKRVGKKTKTDFHISYSFQKKETDTLAVTEDNMPFRDSEGKLVLRPSGHGALLENLNDVDTDIIFVKNIDNVVAEDYLEDTIYYKKLLAGKLIWIQKKVFAYLNILEQDEVEHEVVKEIRSFLWNELSIKDIPEDQDRLMGILNRPIRICGVVKNTGAPGGGPFWVKSEDGRVSLQIVEKSQINMDDPHMEATVNDATHFNPVDIVCGVRDYKGVKFDLKLFSDPRSGIISMKSDGGTPVKALELPGLWNGGMANWNTAFVEVPLETFNPVKTVNDLLHREHRPNA